MTRAKDTSRVSLHRLMLVIRLAKCCQQGNVARSIANLCSIDGLNPAKFYSIIQGSTDLSIVSQTCEGEFDRLLYEWFDFADWPKYHNYDPELVANAAKLELPMSSAAFTARLSMLGQHVCQVTGVPEEPAQQQLFT